MHLGSREIWEERSQEFRTDDRDGNAPRRRHVQGLGTISVTPPPRHLFLHHRQLFILPCRPSNLSLHYHLPIFLRTPPLSSIAIVAAMAPDTS